MQLTGSGHHQTLLGSRNEINLKFFTDSESHTTIFSVGPTTQTNAANTSAGAQRKAPGRSFSSVRHQKVFFHLMISILMEGFWLELNPIRFWHWKHPPYPKNVNTNNPLQGAGIFHLPIDVFMSLKNMKEHFQLSSSFEETVDELGHWMEEIFA